MVILILPLSNNGQIRPNLTVGEGHDGVHTIELCLSITNLYDRDYIMQSIEFQVIVVQFAEGIIEGDQTMEPICLDPRDFELISESISPTIDRNKLETLRSDSKDFELFWQFIRNITLTPGQTLEIACLTNNTLHTGCTELFAFIDCFGTQFTKFTNGFEIPRGDDLCPVLELSPCAKINAYPDSVVLTCNATDEDELMVAWEEIDNTDNYEVRINMGEWQESNNQFSHSIDNLMPGSELSIEFRANTPCDDMPYGMISCTLPERDINDEPDIYIPNAFSPNGDGINDRFKIEPPTGFIIESVKIFTRYGEQVYLTNQAVASWDGIYQTIPVNPQLLWCQVVYNDLFGRTKVITSEVSLIR